MKPDDDTHMSAAQLRQLKNSPCQPGRLVMAPAVQDSCRPGPCHLPPRQEPSAAGGLCHPRLLHCHGLLHAQELGSVQGAGAWHGQGVPGGHSKALGELSARCLLRTIAGIKAQCGFRRLRAVQCAYCDISCWNTATVAGACLKCGCTCRHNGLLPDAPS